MQIAQIEVSPTIVRGLNTSFGPGFAFRWDKDLPDEMLQAIEAKHRDHVHISICP